MSYKQVNSNPNCIFEDGGKTAGAPLPFATYAPLVFYKIGSGAKGSAG